MNMTTVIAPQSGIAASGNYPAGGVDVSGITADWVLKLKVKKFTGTRTVRFAFEDSVDAFVGKMPGPMFSIKGPVSQDAPIEKSFHKREFPSLRIGETDAVLRLALAEIEDGAVDFEAWIEH